MRAVAGNSERNWVLIWAVAIVVLASIPYLWGMAITPPGYHFLGLTHNIDDGAVYLSWMRQTSEGSLFYYNLYTNQCQPRGQFNVLILLMGWFAALTRLPLIWVFHISRVGLGIGLVFAVWKFSRLFLERGNERRMLIPLVGLSAGIGWLIPGAQPPTGSVDVWQPEAITFLSIYLNPLFLAGLILMIGSLYFLLRAHQTGKLSQTIAASACLLVLADVHTYDLLTVACVWTAYLVAAAVAERRIPWRSVGLSALAAVIALARLAYQYDLYSSDPLFRARVNTPLASPPLLSFLTGYGLILIGAILGAVAALHRRSTDTRNSTLNTQHLLPIVWSVVGFAVPYLPVAQQRKLIMGLHIPLCILCVIGLSTLLARASARIAGGLTAGCILLACGSNILFLAKDIRLLNVDDTAPHFPACVSDHDLSAMAYLRERASPRDTVFAPPAFALFTPAFSGRRVYYGHWSETPDYGRKIRLWREFIDPATASPRRLAALRETRTSIYVAPDERLAPPADFTREHMRPVYRSGPVTVYRW